MRALFLLLCLLLSKGSHAQSIYLPFANYPDVTTVERLLECEHAHSLPMLVYQPALENTRRVTSVLLLKKGATTTYWLIRRDTLLARGVLPRATHLFAYSALAQTGATKQEGELKFVPPIMHGIETEQVFYADASRRFYFELGKNVSGYVPDAGRDRYRRKWVQQIRSAVEHLL